jgi:hypothetical protein
MIPVVIVGVLALFCKILKRGRIVGLISLVIHHLIGSHDLDADSVKTVYPEKQVKDHSYYRKIYHYNDPEYGAGGFIVLVQQYMRDNGRVHYYRANCQYNKSKLIETFSDL